MLGYAIYRVLSQLILTNLGLWRLAAYYLQKIIPVENQYKTYNNKLLAIIEAYKIWRYYLTICK